MERCVYTHISSSENRTISAFWASISGMLSANRESIWNTQWFSSTPSMPNLVFSVKFCEENTSEDLYALRMHEAI